MYNNTANTTYTDLLDTETRTSSRKLVAHAGPVYGCSFSPDSSFLLSGSEDGTGAYLCVMW